MIEAATSGDKQFFLGTDSAPHSRQSKESDCGCAGSYTAYSAIELYAECFDLAGKLDRLEGFASFFGPDFYRLPRNTRTITLEKNSWQLPAALAFAEGDIIPLRAGQSIAWQLVNE